MLALIRPVEPHHGRHALPHTQMPACVQGNNVLWYQMPFHIQIYTHIPVSVLTHTHTQTLQRIIRWSSRQAVQEYPTRPNPIRHLGLIVSNCSKSFSSSPVHYQFITSITLAHDQLMISSSPVHYHFIISSSLAHHHHIINWSAVHHQFTISYSSALHQHIISS